MYEQRQMSRVARVALQLALAAVFLYAGVVKILDPATFATEIINYRLWPQLGPTLAVLLPGMEITVGAALLLPTRAWRSAAALAACALLAVFTVAVLQAVMRHIDVRCGCFGEASGPVTWMTVGRDVGLLCAAVVLTFLSRNATTTRLMVKP